jgi:hypothetical protein
MHWMCIKLLRAMSSCYAVNSLLDVPDLSKVVPSYANAVSMWAGWSLCVSRPSASMRWIWKIIEYALKCPRSIEMPANSTFVFVRLLSEPSQRLRSPGFGGHLSSVVPVGNAWIRWSVHMTCVYHPPVLSMQSFLYGFTYWRFHTGLTV